MPSMTFIIHILMTDSDFKPNSSLDRVKYDIGDAVYSRDAFANAIEEAKREKKPKKIIKAMEQDYDMSFGMRDRVKAVRGAPENNAWLNFVKRRRERVLKENPGVKQKDVLTILSGEWKQLSQAEKNTYKNATPQRSLEAIEEQFVKMEIEQIRKQYRQGNKRTAKVLRGEFIRGRGYDPVPELDMYDENVILSYYS